MRNAECFQRGMRSAECIECGMFRVRNLEWGVRSAEWKGRMVAEQEGQMPILLRGEADRAKEQRFSPWDRVFRDEMITAKKKGKK